MKDLKQETGLIRLDDVASKLYLSEKDLVLNILTLIEDKELGLLELYKLQEVPIDKWNLAKDDLNSHTYSHT